jgi:hypothetical protein
MTGRDNEFNIGHSRAEARIVDRLRGLPRDVPVAVDLWPRIASCIGDPAENAIRRLPRVIETTRDLWPGINARLQARNADGRTSAVSGPRRFSVISAAGVVAVLVLSALISAQLRLLSEAQDVYGSAIGSAAFESAARLPLQVNDVFDRFENALPGTHGAAVREAAREIRRDLIMTRFERFRIEQALAGASDNRILTTQWRHD